MSYENKGTVAPTAIVSLEPDRSGNFVCDAAVESYDVTIQRAIDHISTVLGMGTVVLKGGSYTNIAAKMTVPSNITLLMRDAYLALANGVNDHMFENSDTIGGNENIKFIGGRLWGNELNNAGGSGIHLQTALRTHIEEMWIRDFDAHGVFLDTGASVTWIESCRISGNNDNGIACATGDNFFMSNDVGTNGESGISLYSGGGLNHIEGNQIFENVLDGLRILNQNDNIIYGNWFDKNQRNGISLYASAQHIEGTVIVSNVVRDNGQGAVGADDNGIKLNDSAGAFYCLNTLIDDNVIRDTQGVGSTQDYGLEILSNSIRTRALNNIYDGNTSGAINDSGIDTILPKVFSEVTDPDSNVGDHPALVLPDAADTTFRFQVPIPLGFQELVTAQVIVVQTATGGPPDMQWSTTTDWGKLCAGENYNAGSDAETDQTTAVTQNNLVCIDVSASLTGIAAGDLVGFTFIRRATQGGDTIDADAHYLGFRLRYV